MKKKILLAEDDPNLGVLLKEYLDSKDYAATLVTDGEAGFKAFTKETYELCIFDVMMPVKDGFTLAKEIRDINPTVPIIFLTAKSMKEDVFQGFKIGADDYMTKPFSMEELTYRIEAILKRTDSSTQANANKTTFELGIFNFDTNQHKLFVEDRAIKLTTKETDLLKLLCINQDKVLERNIALKSIWHDDSIFNARSMDVYITKLRKYLKEDPNIEILNIHGKGYKLIVHNNNL